MDARDTGQAGRRPWLTVAAVALALAAVPAGVALANSGGESSGSEAQAPDATFIQEQAPRGETPPGDGDRGDGRDCPKDRQGNEGDQPGSGEEGSSFPGYGPPDTTQL